CRGTAKKETIKTLHIPLPTEVKTLDPAYSEDAYSHQVMKEIFEPLYQYAYLERPLKLEPCLAADMPTVSADGKIYDINIKPGIFFIDDPAFPQGKGREVKSDDLIYSIKRLADAKVNSSGWWLVDNRIVGLNEFREHSKAHKPTNYDDPVAGLKATGPYSLRI